MSFEITQEPRLSSSRIELALPCARDKLALLSFHHRNYDFFKPWLPRPNGNLRDPEFWAAWIDLSQRLYSADAAIHFVLRLNAQPDLVIGQVDYSAICRGPLNSAMLGFQLDERFQGRGLMTEAIGLSLDFVFRRRKIYRVTAAYIEENERSARVLTSLGFLEEGRARGFLEIDGKRRDHVIVARLAADFVAKPPDRLTPI